MKQGTECGIFVMKLRGCGPQLRRVEMPFESETERRRNQMKDEMLRNMEELKERLAAEAPGHPGHNHPGETQTNDPGQEPKDEN